MLKYYNNAAIRTHFVPSVKCRPAIGKRRVVGLPAASFSNSSSGNHAVTRTSNSRLFIHSNNTNTALCSTSTVRYASTTSAATTTSPPTTSTTIPTTTPLSIYIESTDAFQVVYYANYFKFLQWGVLDHYNQQQQQQQQQNDKDGSVSASPSLIRHVTNMKYRKPAVLGDAVDIITTPKVRRSFDEQTGAAAAAAYFEQTIVRRGTNEVLISADVITEGLLRSAPTNNNDSQNQKKVSQRKVDSHVLPGIRVLPDEVSGWLSAGGSSSSRKKVTSLSLDACLRYIERGRSDWIGGPEALRKLQHPPSEQTPQEPMTVVVAKIDDMRYYYRSGEEAAISVEQDSGVVPGASTVRVESTVSLNRSIISFQQKVFVDSDPDDTDDGDQARSDKNKTATPIMEATVMCCCVSTATGKPVMPPNELLQKFNKS